ncbi:filamentous hemagglutinin family protein [Sandaracinobacter sp. RS1-74]|uniref:filamentous hemagglutinin family protein n=1 Tax=Sandaracinobacteroides sayramensis TaxID=2913411 RepID=UPI001EDA3AF1|nr:filamentous hemagglutinin family protein [Sandaracinobacteroides sayramensis]MCG2841224.1 filamentous hemagglutinin family protein [Sandaracinobacteroides sayramensis]
MNTRINARSARQNLLLTVSLGALLLAGTAHAQSTGRAFPSRGASGANPSSVIANTLSDQATKQAETSSATQRAIETFRRAAAARAAMQNAQIQARAAAKAASLTNPFNGIGANGLKQAADIEIDPSLWVGAGDPTATTGADGRTAVSIDQTQQKAILTWDSFNIGRETDLTFNQGGADWVVLNRVHDANASQILGTLTAPGTVLILNRNGVLFGGASKVNVRNLIASSANITNDDFLNRGIYSSLSGANYVPSFTDALGAVTVEAGAQITTHDAASATDGGGYVLLMGTQVTNAGTITTPKGQTLLSAGDDFIVRKGYGTEENQYSTTRGNEVRGLIDAESESGTVINRGLIEAAQGDITLAGRTIRQEGVAVATTGVNQRGTIHLLNSASDAEGSVTLASGWELTDAEGNSYSGDGLTIILPELESADTALNSQRDSLIAESETANANRYTTITGGFNDRSMLADRLDQSRIEIVTGGNVLFEGGSHTSAQGGQVAVQAAGRITVADGALIDVSGVQGVKLDMESNSILVNVQGNELRDSPQNRENDDLRNNDVWIDVRDLVLLPDGTGGYDGDRWYTAGGLLEVGGYVANMEHGIGEWAAVGGTITLAANEVVAHQGAVFDISGGSIDYQAGWVLSTRVLGADGKIYDIGQVPAGIAVVGYGRTSTREHERWGEQYTQTWSHSLFSGRSSSRWEDGYSVGRDAGRLVLSAPTVIMEAEIAAEAINGARQTKAREDGVADGYKLGEHTVAQAGSLVLGRYDLALNNTLPYTTDVRIGDIADITPDMAPDVVLPEPRAGTAWFDATRLSEAGLGGLDLATQGTIAIESDLTLADGGAVELVAPTIDIAADVTARSGSISATNWFVPQVDATAARPILDADGGSLITLRDGATLDVRGLWVNTALDAADTNKLGLVDGGDVYLASTHDLTLEAGSLIDVSSGAAWLDQNETLGGIGGNVTLIADLENLFTTTADGLLTLDGQIAGFGVNGGGTLKIESGTAISIGGELLETDGLLKAGEASPVELVLLDDYDVKVGDTLPVDYNYTVNVALPGETVPSTGLPLNRLVTTAADWVLPESSEYTSFSARIAENYYYNGYEYRSGSEDLVPGGGINRAYNVTLGIFETLPVVPAGVTLFLEYAQYSSIFAGYVVPADVFPNGFPIANATKTLKAGNPSPVNMTVAAGSKIAAGVALEKSVAVKTNTELAASIFQSGFSNYDVTARNGIAVKEGTALDVSAPVYRFTTASASAETGADPASALELWTPPLYLEDPANGVLTQRQGASLTLRSSRYVASNTRAVTAGGPLVVAEGASITVDPGQSINLLGFDMTIEGSLVAPSGRITLDLPEDYDDNVYGNPDPDLIWIGDNAVLDVAARPALAIDHLGRSYGLIADGGTIAIGGGLDWEDSGEAFAHDAFVVIRPGAKLDASGTSGKLDIAGSGLNSASTPVTVASDGGTIIVKSNNGLYLDGTLRADAGGDGAAGGTLALALEAPNYVTATTSGDVLNFREFVVAQERSESPLSEGATAQTVASELSAGTARFSVEQIEAGGFDNLALLVDGPLSFDGDVSLDMGQSLRLYTGTYALADGTAADTTVSLSAPYVRLAGVVQSPEEYATVPAVRWANGPSRQATDALFKVKASLIDIRDQVGFGARKGTADRRGFSLVDLTSSGDLRLLAGSELTSITGGLSTELATSGDLLLTAAQIYPATGTRARIIAGFQPYGSKFVEGSSLTVRRYSDGDVAMPYSAFGYLSLHAETINQGGIVRAPLGTLLLGSETYAALTDSVNLLTGSITSVSGAGLTMPYGGTADGISYTYDGEDVELSAINRMTADTAAMGIGFRTAHLSTEEGSTIDLSGGGELTGAGFVTGRGGSVDVLKTAFINSNPGYGFSSEGNTVYAIVPSDKDKVFYAPVAAEAGYSDPLIGQQITIPEGVPGLDAGTYTLMPSTYALMKDAAGRPIGYRVEIGAGNQTALKGVTAIGNGSYIAAATLSVANTGIGKALPNQVIITPGETVRAHSSYNEMSYNEFVLADAARIGVPRALMTVDARTLDIALFANASDDARDALSIGGEVLLDAEADSEGYAGTVQVRGIGEVIAAGQEKTEGFSGVSVHDTALNALEAPRLVLNGYVTVPYGQTGRYVTITGAGSLAIRSGAEITAGDVILAGQRTSSSVDGLISVEEGASIIAKAGNSAAFDSSDGYVFRGEGILAVSSGWLNLLLAQPTGTQVTGVNIDIGTCVSDTCDGTTTLVSDGTIAIATNRAFTIAENVSYGTENLVLGLSSINLGEGASIEAASAAGTLPAGLVLNDTRLADLLAGNSAIDAPALKTLVLNASDSVNVYGSVDLDASSLESVVFGTPAIYGYGADSDVATIRASEFIWAGAEGTAGAPVASFLGKGTLDIEANSILFGYGANTQPASTAIDDRIALGFANVVLSASEKISASGESTLSVYETRGDYVTGEGWEYIGGNLQITAPIITGEAASSFSIAAGGDVTISAPEGAATDATSDALGAQLAIVGQSITLDTAVVLSSGKLTLAAVGDVDLGDNARIDLAGREVNMFDVKQYSWGGDLILASTDGDIAAAEGSSIDLSADYNRGGTMTVTALGNGAGHVSLAGTILGSASGEYDAGGTYVPYDAAELTVQAQTLADFADLNSRLNDGEVFGARRFQIKQGDLTVGDEVKAREVQIVVDGGDLTVNGTIDASGYQVGTIRLAAMGDLTVNGTLNAHGTGLRVDSYGKIIDSPNRAIVDLTSREGTLILASSAAIDLRAGTDVATGTEAGQNDGAPRGTLDLNAARVGTNDVAIDVAGTPTIQGVKTIAVNAFRTYDDAPLATQADVSGERPQLITQAYLDTIDGHSQAFINAALVNTDLSDRLAGLGDYHLRPGVEIVSNAETNPSGTLTIAGDLDLSGYRYGPEANRSVEALRGYGEPGVLTIRAAGDLNIYGSINDGFARPAGTPDDSGWVLTEGVTPFGGDITVPVDGVVLDAGTTFNAGYTGILNYDVPLTAMRLASGTVLPVKAELAGSYTLAVGTVVDATIYNVDDSIAYEAGTVLVEAVTLTAGMKLGAGTALNANTNVAALLWPKGVALPVALNTSNARIALVTSAPITLARGSFIPSMTSVQLGGNQPVNLRTASGGKQGLNWAVAEMLGEGATSWTMQQVSGADLSSAYAQALDPASKGSIGLADTHYITTSSVVAAYYTWAAPGGVGGNPTTAVLDGVVPNTTVNRNRCNNGTYTCTFHPESTTVSVLSPLYSVLRTGTGDLSLVAAGDIRMDSLYGVYTAGTASSVEEAYDLARGTLTDGSVLGSRTADYAGVLADYHAWYPDQGGNLLISAGGDLVGDILANGWASATDVSSVVSGTWLWRQGSGSAAVDEEIPTAWWINYGTYARVQVGNSTIGSPILVGFTGFGTLGGGDVTVRVGGDAGKITTRGTEANGANATTRSQGLVIAVGSTGRVGTDGSLVLTGGGDLDMRIAGALNPLSETTDRNSKAALGGSIINLRGATQVDASSIGVVQTAYRTSTAENPVDPRGADPFEASSATSFSGLVLVPGDSAVYLQTLGDLVTAGAGDATRSELYNTSGFTLDGTSYSGGGRSWFSLWTANTAINLVSAGGNMAPSKGGFTDATGNENARSADFSDTWPSILRISALGGSIYYGASAGYTSISRTSDLLAPSSNGELSVLAAGSIYGGARQTSSANTASRHIITLTASGTEVPTPFNPAFIGRPNTTLVGNVSVDGTPLSTDIGATYRAVTDYGLFPFGANTAATAATRSAEAEPVRIYAISGDIVGVGTGEIWTFYPQTGRSLLAWYLGGAPVWMQAGRDIVSSGTQANPNLIVHSNESDVSVISAGRDILYSNFQIAGPGALEVSAGRNILQEDQGSFTSIGSIVADDTRAGASIALMAGMTDVNWDAFRDLYLNPESLADPDRPLAEQNGVKDDGTVESVAKVVKTYEGELTLGDWLRAEAGYTGDDAGAAAWLAGQDAASRRNLEAGYAQAGKSYLVNWLTSRYADFDPVTGDALAYFDSLAPEHQRIFLRQVFYTEAREGGREYNDADGPRFGSYLRGRLAIAALFPDKDADGSVIERNGDIIMYRGSGVRTNFGGDISMLSPGGQIVVGVQNVMTAEDQKTAGVMTQGVGDINLFSEQSLLLGLSRIMTTYGGSIFAWSEEGDINAGRGAKTDVLIPPARRTYDRYGNVKLAPQVPSSGAGIATLNPIPEVTPGDVDLIAPLGTIDAGEAGIRASRNINLAALQVLNAANIKVQGEAKGISVVAAVNTGALTSASSAASAVANQAAELAERARPQVRTEVPVIVQVRLLGFGEQP